jgi:hypothetical protein
VATPPNTFLKGGCVVMEFLLGADRERGPNHGVGLAVGVVNAG